MASRLSLGLLVLVFAVTGGSLIRWSAQADDSSPRTPPRQYLNPLGVALDLEGKRAYVVLNRAAVVAEVDLASGQVVRRIPTGVSPRAVAYHMGMVCVADAENDALVIPTAGGPAKRVPYAQLPREVHAIFQRDLPPWTPSVPRAAFPPGVLATFPPLQGLHAPRRHDSSQELMLRGAFANFLLVSNDWLAGSPRLGFGGAFQGALGFAGGGNQTGLGFGGNFGNLGGSYGGFGGWGSPLPVQFAGINPNGFHAPLDLGTTSSALPTGVVFHPWSDAVFVSAAGSDCVLHLRSSGLREFFPKLPDQASQAGFNEHPPDPAATMNPPTYLVQRLPTQAAPGPMAVSADGATLVVCNVLADSLTVIACRPQPRVVRHIPLGGPAPHAARRGEILFHSARLSKNGRFACVSCHLSGGGDGVRWHMPGGEEFARVTRPLHGVRETAPYGWLGDDETLSVHVSKTLKHLFQYKPTDGELSDLVAYLESLPASEPFPVAPGERAAVERGRAIFENKANCQRCHQGETFQDGQRHPIGTTTGEFDTPSLRGVGRRRSLFHDGRAGGLDNIFDAHFFGGMQREIGRLTDEERKDLVAFLRSL